MQDGKARILAELAPKIMSAFHDLGRQRPAGKKLSMRQFQALIILNADEKMTLSELCKKLNLAPSTATELVDRIIALEFVQKAGESADRRQVVLSLTPKGMQLLKKRQQALAEMFSTFLKQFNEKDQQVFIESFERIWQLIEKHRAKNKNSAAQH